MIEQQTQSTIDHEAIKAWAQARSGTPAVIRRTKGVLEDDTPIRINFPDYSCDEDVEEISWEMFFHIFESANLAFVYHEKTILGEKSHYYTFIKRDR